MESCSMEFSGRLLKRGFWLYIWDIKEEGRRHLYVGRTGDSSSPHAASPFRRIGQHLDGRDGAKANLLYRRLRDERLDPERCTFEMTAIGPLFEEQLSMDEHRPVRDTVAALEGALARELRERGYDVLGTHPDGSLADPAMMLQVLNVVDARFPQKSLADVLNFEPIRLRDRSISVSDLLIHEREDRI
jgi:hypothetical protein